MTRYRTSNVITPMLVTPQHKCPDCISESLTNISLHYDSNMPVTDTFSFYGSFYDCPYLSDRHSFTLPIAKDTAQ